MADDQQIVRDLAQQYLEATQTAENDERRELWRQLNSLRSARPLVHIRGGRVWSEVPQVQVRECEDPVLRNVEGWLRLQIYRATLGDDTVFEPWVPCRAVFACQGWGVHARQTRPDEEKGSYKETHPLTDLEDLSALQTPRHAINEEATAQKYETIVDAVGDLIHVDLDRTPCYTVWSGDIATDLGHLRGIEATMMDMYDEPDALHALLAFLRDGILKVHEEAEAAGDWGLTSHENQSMPYADELEDGAPNRRGMARKDLWGYMAAQELTLVSPQMHDEFMLQYQIPILKHFGLVAYGCCEDLTRKIEMVKKIPNLRRIAVAPLANIDACAEQIAGEYVISYRPNPADMVCVGFDESKVRSLLGRALAVFRGQHLEINLKDVDTCENDPARLAKWARVAREMVEETACAGAA